MSGFNNKAASLGGSLPTQSTNGAGSAYQLTTSPALVNLGTTVPRITITLPGTYLILARALVNYNAATFAAVRNVTLKLRRTNNTAADLTGGSTSFKTQIITTLTYTAAVVQLPAVLYTTQNIDDIVEVWGSIDTGPTAGSIDVAEANIVAIKIA